MKRRDVLALLSSAPIAALAPLPKVLAQLPTIRSNARGFRNVVLLSGGHAYEFDGTAIHVLDE